MTDIADHVLERFNKTPLFHYAGHCMSALSTGLILHIGNGLEGEIMDQVGANVRDIVWNELWSEIAVEHTK